MVIIDCGQNGAPRLSKFGLNSSGLLWKAYSVLDDRTMQPYPDPFEPADIRATLETSATVTVQPIAKGLDYYLADQEVSAIRSYSIDVVLDFAGEKLEGSAIGMARYGIWRCFPCCNVQNGSPPQEFWALRRGYCYPI